MSMTIQDSGALSFLNARLNNIFPSSKDLTLKLFCNNITPSDIDVASDYTEAIGGGYAAKTLISGSWTVSIVSNIAQAAYSLQTFAFTGVLTTNPSIYGYYIIDSDGSLITSELFTAPATPTVDGDYLTITPIIKASKGTPN